MCLYYCVLVLLIREYDVHDGVANPQSLATLMRITGLSACKLGSKFTHCTSNEYTYPYNVQLV